MTKKVVAPVVRLKRLLRKVGTGRLVVQEKLDRGDELSDLFDTFLEMTHSLRALQSDWIASIDEVLDKERALGAREEVSAGLQTLREQLSRGLRASDPPRAPGPRVTSPHPLLEIALQSLCARFEAMDYGVTPIIDLATLVAEADGKIDEREVSVLRYLFQESLGTRLSPEMVSHLIKSSLKAVEASDRRARAQLVTVILLDCDAVEEGLTIALACAGGLFVVAWRWSEATWSSIAIAALLVAPSAGSLGVTAPATARDSVTRTPLWALAAAKARDKTNPAAPLRVYRPPRLYEEQHELTVAEAIATLTGAAAARFGLGAARSEDPARPPSHDQLWLSASSVGGALLERYGIQLAILPGAMEGRNLVELARRGQSALAQFPSAPPAAMVFEWVWVADDAAAIARLFPPGTSRGLPIGLAVLHGSGPDQQDEPRAPEPCTIIRWARGAIDLTCASQDASYAVVSSTNARGWTVEVNGADTPWVTADVMRRAVALPGGAHIVSWRYEAPGLVAGVTLAGLGVLGLLALLVWSLRVRREPTPDDHPLGTDDRCNALLT